MDQGNQSGCEILIQMNFQHCRSMQGMMAAGMCHLVTSISSSEASSRGVRCRHFFQATKLLQVLVKCLPQEGKAMLFFVSSFPCDAQF